jgi:hypothetical protein
MYIFAAKTKETIPALTREIQNFLSWNLKTRMYFSAAKTKETIPPLTRKDPKLLSWDMENVNDILNIESCGNEEWREIPS